MGSDWCKMRIQWASMDGPGVGVNAVSVSALVSVCGFRLLLLMRARMRHRNNDGWRERETAMLVTLSGPLPVLIVRPCASVYDVIQPATSLYGGVICVVRNARSCAASFVPRLNRVEVVVRIV